MSGFYLSLNQGWTYFKRKYNTKEGKVRLAKCGINITLAELLNIYNIPENIVI